MGLNISFTSTYKVNNKANDYDKFAQFGRLALDKEANEGAKADLKECQKSNCSCGGAEYTLIAPDRLDDEIETYCLNRGIEFKKLSFDDLLNPQSITNRIKQPKSDMNIIYIDSKKLDELIKNQESNIEHCENDYNEYYSPSVDSMLKDGKKIPVTTLDIHGFSPSIDDEIDYIEKFGADNLNPNQLFVDFYQQTDEPDHCVYFALKELGMKNIPVYANDDTCKIANALGIVAKEND